MLECLDNKQWYYLDIVKGRLWPVYGNFFLTSLINVHSSYPFVDIISFDFLMATSSYFFSWHDNLYHDLYSYVFHCCLIQNEAFVILVLELVIFKCSSCIFLPFLCYSEKYSENIQNKLRFMYSLFEQIHYCLL